MVRGIEKRQIFLDDRDRERLADRLGDLIVELGARCYAWAFMPNHVHLVLRTGMASVSKLMQRAYTSYALHFNRRYGRVGHLVQNRFKSKLVEDESYLLPLVRYVHRNPLEAGIVCSLAALERYPWCGHGALMGRRAAGFEAVGDVLERFASNPTLARRRLRAWMRAENRDETSVGAVEKPSECWYRSGPAPGAEPRDDGLRRETLSLDELMRSVCGRLGVSVEDLLAGRRDSATARARALIAHRATGELGLPGVEVARALRVSPSAVVQAAARGRKAPLP
jgi:REP element-mobilizing transposase RayT